MAWDSEATEEALGVMTRVLMAQLSQYKGYAVEFPAGGVRCEALVCHDN